MSKKNKNVNVISSNVFLNKLYKIRNNVLKMLTDRGYGETIQKNYGTITFDEFEDLYTDPSKNIHINLFVRESMNDKNENDGNDIIKEQVLVYFIYSLIDMDKAHFRKIMQAIKLIFDEKALQNRVIIIYPDPSEEKKKVTIPGYVDEEQKELNKKDKKIILETFSHSELAVDKTNHILQPKFILLTDEEAKNTLKELGIEKNSLPKIYYYDPMAKYYGAKIGDIFKIIRTSPTSGVNANVYRVVIEY
jgi:DNA-directed RNA polymerase subunit H (RpoH/RPB5)